MTTAIYILFAAYALIAFVHMSYVYVMGLKRARDNGTLHWTVYPFAYPTMAVMLPFYVMLNLTIATVSFLEFPRSLQFTARCTRHIDSDTWRGRQARFWCRHFLEPFDEGHCRL